MENPFFELQTSDFLKKAIYSIDGRLLPVSNIYCVGQNYVKHIEELKSINVGKPLIFSKPSTSIIEEGEDIIYPDFSENVHHEVEIAVYISKKCKNISEDEVKNIIGGYAIALDLTCRDIQSEAKKIGGPWLISKGFDTSCPITKIYPFKDIDDLMNKSFYLKKNDILVQQSNASLMIFTIPKLVSYISNFFTLQVGDIILTGTPEGVGPIQRGDILSFGADSVKEVKFKVI